MHNCATFCLNILLQLHGWGVLAYLTVKVLNKHNVPLSFPTFPVYLYTVNYQINKAKMRGEKELHTKSIPEILWECVPIPKQKQTSIKKDTVCLQSVCWECEENRGKIVKLCRESTDELQVSCGFALKPLYYEIIPSPLRKTRLFYSFLSGISPPTPVVKVKHV